MSKGLGPLRAHPPSTNLDVLGVTMKEERLWEKPVPILHLSVTRPELYEIYWIIMINYIFIMNLCDTELSEIKT